jgi:hypothetical protein
VLYSVLSASDSGSRLWSTDNDVTSRWCHTVQASVAIDAMALNFNLHAMKPASRHRRALTRNSAG